MFRPTSFPVLILPFCFMSSTTGMIRSVSVKRDIYVPPDVNQMTPDARKWYLAGISNANKDLEAFGAIADGITKGEDTNAKLKKELSHLLTQVVDANDNTKELVPKLRYLVESLFSWTRDPGWLDKIKLKATICYINGKRDNKSYYLQNGAGLWFKLRLDDYLKKIPKPNTNAEKLIADFETLEDKVLTARDTLDDAAQEYVKGIAQLIPLVQDIGKNVKEIQGVVNLMKSEMNTASQPILTTAQDAVDVVKAKIDSL